MPDDRLIPDGGSTRSGPDGIGLRPNDGLSPGFVGFRPGDDGSSPDRIASREDDP